jgi:hypothetical protein
MRKQLGVGQKSAEGVLLDRTRHCGEEGPNEEVQGRTADDLNTSDATALASPRRRGAASRRHGAAERLIVCGSRRQASLGLCHRGSDGVDRRAGEYATGLATGPSQPVLPKRLFWRLTASLSRRAFPKSCPPPSFTGILEQRP